MKRIDAEKILLEWVENPGLRRHCLCVALVMEAIGRQAKQDQDTFYIAGLLHDADWEKFPVEHPNLIVKFLRDIDEEEIAYAISAHGTEWGKGHLSLLDRALVAVDELTGLIYAIAKIRPEGLK